MTKGFSCKNAVLDMRFNRAEGKEVSEYINELPEREIEYILNHMDKKNSQENCKKYCKA